MRTIVADAPAARGARENISRLGRRDKFRGVSCRRLVSAALTTVALGPSSSTRVATCEPGATGPSIDPNRSGHRGPRPRLHGRRRRVRGDQGRRQRPVRADPAPATGWRPQRHGLGLPAPDDALVAQGHRGVLEGQQLAYGRIRITYTAGISPLGSGRDTQDPTLVVVVTDAARRIAAIDQGRRRPLAAQRAGAIAGLKTTSYAENVVALAYAAERDASEAIFANTAGNLCEGTGTNVFCVFGEHRRHAAAERRLPRRSDPRPGRSSGATSHERDITMEEFAQADEVFLTSTTRDVQAIHDIDGEALIVTRSPRPSRRCGAGASPRTWIPDLPAPARNCAKVRDSGPGSRKFPQFAVGSRGSGEQPVEEAGEDGPADQSVRQAQQGPARRTSARSSQDTVDSPVPGPGVTVSTAQPTMTRPCLTIRQTPARYRRRRRREAARTSPASGRRTRSGRTTCARRSPTPHPQPDRATASRW